MVEMSRGWKRDKSQVKRKLLLEVGELKQEGLL